MIPEGFTVVAGSLGDQGGSVARTLKRTAATSARSRATAGRRPRTAFSTPASRS